MDLGWRVAYSMIYGQHGALQTVVLVHEGLREHLRYRGISWQGPKEEIIGYRQQLHPIGCPEIHGFGDHPREAEDIKTSEDMIQTRIP